MRLTLAAYEFMIFFFKWFRAVFNIKFDAKFRRNVTLTIAAVQKRISSFDNLKSSILRPGKDKVFSTTVSPSKTLLEEQVQLETFSRTWKYALAQGDLSFFLDPSTLVFYSSDYLTK